MPYKCGRICDMELYLGELEQLILLALLRLDDNAYGVTVLRELSECAGRDLSLGTIYKTLWRLEQKGYVSTWISEATTERGGRRKKMYQLRPLGKKALKQSLEGLKRLAKGLDKGIVPL